MTFFLAILSALLYLVGFIPYIYHTFRGRVVPHAFSWTVWAILSAINTYSLIGAEGWDISVLSPMVRTSALLFGAIVAWFFVRKIHISGLDYIAIGLAILCLYVAFHFGVHNAIIPTILVDILVLFPTLKKTWYDPYSEGLSAWVITIFSQACLLLALPEITWQNALFWIYVMTMNALVSLFIVMRRQYMKKYTDGVGPKIYPR